MFLTVGSDGDGKENCPSGSGSATVCVKAKGEGLGRWLLSRRSWGCERDEDIRQHIPKDKERFIANLNRLNAKTKKLTRETRVVLVTNKVHH